MLIATIEILARYRSSIHFTSVIHGSFWILILRFALLAIVL